MSKDTVNSLFIVSSMRRFYQHLFSGIAIYEELGSRVIKQIKMAHAFRQTDKVRELSRILLNIPIKECQLIAQYYLVWCRCRESRLYPDILQDIVTESSTYKTKALLSLAGFEGLKGNLDSELYLYTEALKSASNISDYTQGSMGIAVVKAKEGFHKSALKDLESLILSIKHTEPIIYFDVLNSYAVELSEAGYKQGARNIIKHVIESPFAFAYPEWQSTADDLKEANRSFVGVNLPKIIPQNVLTMPAIEHVESRQTGYKQPANVFNMQNWKKKMAKGKKGKKDNGDDVENVNEMDDKDLLATLIHIAASDDIDTEQLRDVVKYAIKVTSQPSKPEPDDTNGA